LNPTIAMIKPYCKLSYRHCFLPAYESMSKKPLLTISLAAKKAGIGVETIRYYQRIGLIEEPPKPLSGYRVYPEDTVARLRFIQRAKELGFSLSEISSLLTLGSGNCKETQELAAYKLNVIKRKIEDLQSLASTLEELIRSCEDNPSQQKCPLIEAISKN
jgi:Hg(II)-responsive transcriptional regulator